MSITTLNKNIIYLITQYLKIQEQLALYITCKKLYDISPFAPYKHSNNKIYIHKYIKISYKDLNKYEFTNLKFIKFTDDYVNNIILLNTIIGIRGNFTGDAIPNIQIYINDSSFGYSYCKNDIRNIESHKVYIDFSDLMIENIKGNYLYIDNYIKNIVIFNIYIIYDIYIYEDCSNIKINRLKCKKLSIKSRCFNINIDILTCNYIDGENFNCKKLNLYFDSDYDYKYCEMKFNNINIDFYGFNNFKFEESQFLNCNYKYI